MGRSIEQLRPPATAAPCREVVVVAILADADDLADIAPVEAAAAETIVVASTTDATQPLLRDVDGDGDGPIPAVSVDGAVLERLATRAREQAAELERLRATQDRTARVERAKGILMARHGIGDQKAADMLRRHARSTHVRLVDVADAVLTSFALFTPHDGTAPSPSVNGGS